MAIDFNRYLHSQNGKVIISILLGFGLASLFRTICKGKSCVVFHAPPLDEIKDKIYKSGNKCVKYNYIPTKCKSKAKIVEFE